MADVTASQMLTAVNAAILKLLQNPASFVSLDGRQFSYQDLDKLRKLRTELRQEVQDTGGSSEGGTAPARPFASGFSVNPIDF